MVDFNNKKILIIKTGLSETFSERESNSIPSLGDVFRTTFILNYLKEAKTIDWFVHRDAKFFLEGIDILHNIYTDSLNLQEEKYDLVINLEKDKSLYFVTEDFLGFKWQQGDLYCQYKDKTVPYEEINTDDTYQHLICNILGLSWNEEKYILGYKPLSNEINQVGLNWKVGSKWPEKQLDKSFWENLENKLFEKEISASWQRGFSNLAEYIDWINSCSIIISADSLGLHIALALKKQVIGLFGPTNSNQIESYKQLEKIHYSENDDIDILVEKLVCHCNQEFTNFL